MALSIVAADLTSTGSSRSPVADLSGVGYSAQTDDIVVMGVRAGNGGVTSVTPSGWGNVLGGNTTVTVTGITVVLVYHVVTAGEIGNDAFTPTNLWDSAQNSGQIVWALRGGDTVTPVDKAASASNDTAGTTHVLAGLTGGNAPARTGDLVLGFIAGGGTATYTDPSGWTLDDKNSGGQGQRAGYHRNTLTEAGVDVTATNITSSGSTRYAGVTAAFSDPSVTQGNPGAFFAWF